MVRTGIGFGRYDGDRGFRYDFETVNINTIEFRYKTSGFLFEIRGFTIAIYFLSVVRISSSAL